MARKRSEVDRSKIDYGSDLEQRIQSQYDRESNKAQPQSNYQSYKQKLFAIHGGAWLIFKWLRKQTKLLPWLMLLIFIFTGVYLPFLFRAKAANLNIPPIIYLGILFICCDAANYFLTITLYKKADAFYKELISSDNPSAAMSRDLLKPLYIAGFGVLIILLLILLGIHVFIYLPFLIHLVTSTLGIHKWLSAIIILLCPITYIDKTRSKSKVTVNGINMPGDKVYGLKQLNLPLYVYFFEQGNVVYQPWLLWWLKNHRQENSYTPEYEQYAQKYINRHAPKYVGINILGGLLPIAVACWQFNRVEANSILLVAIITTIFCYFSVKISSLGNISLKKRQIQIIVLAVSILAIGISDRLHAGAIAYAGITLGTLIGADILHFKLPDPEQAYRYLNIGGAGVRDGIVICGLYTMLTVEFFWELRF
ncbi:MAG: DUF1614 domain-containing protein [Cyanobacteria bacterium J06623_7]